MFCMSGFAGIRVDSGGLAAGYTVHGKVGVRGAEFCKTAAHRRFEMGHAYNIIGRHVLARLLHPARGAIHTTSTEMLLFLKPRHTLSRTAGVISVLFLLFYIYMMSAGHR